MKWIGLTGGIATGKSSVVKILQDLGLPVVDADQLARQAVVKGSPALQQIVKKFGAEVLKPNGELDRKVLGQKVFRDTSKLRELEAIVHPVVQKLAREERGRLESQGFAYAFYDVPLLFEKNLQDQYDLIVVISALENQQKDRMKLRDQLSDEEIEQRLASQTPLQTKIDGADFVIDNSGNLADLKAQVLAMVKFVESA